MGTSANIYIKTEKETLKYNVSKDGGFSTLGIYLLGKLHYQKDDFLQEFDENDMFDFEDKYQNYVYHIDFEKTSMSVFEVQNGDEIVHIEIQNNNHKQMHLRMCRYYTDILFLYEDYKVSQYMVYIGKDKCYMKSQIQRDKMNYSYDIIDMRDIACEELIQSNDPSAIALSILCDFKGKDKQTVINTILRKLRELNDDKKNGSSYMLDIMLTESHSK